MADRSIASRPSLEQVVAIVDYMEKHPALALGQLRGLEGREESKKLWLILTRIVNGIHGPTRPMKSWIKYWADKKSSVRSKVQSGGGDPDNLCSNLEKKIWDLFLADDQGKQHGRGKNMKRESENNEEPYFNDDSMEQVQSDDNAEPVAAEPTLNYEQRQNNVMEKLESGYRIVDIQRRRGIACRTIYFWLRRHEETGGDLSCHHRQFYQRATTAVQDSAHTEKAFNSKKETALELSVSAMSAQATALGALARATQLGSRAAHQLAASALLQARAVERLAVSLESVRAPTLDVRAAVLDIDETMKRFYTNHT